MNIYHKDGEKKFNRWICSLVVLLSLAAIVGAIIYSGGFLFRTNDDIYLRAILSGDLTGKPDAHAVYILYPLSWILSFLYRIFPFVEWYGLFIISSHLFCWSVVNYRSVSLGDNRRTQFRNFFLSFFVLFLLDFSWLALSQYTALAGILFCTAIFYFVTLKDHTIGKKYIPFILLITISFLLRNMVALMCLGFVFCYMLYKLVFAKENKSKEELIKLLKTYGLVLCVIIVSWGALYGLNMLAYQSDEWKEYNEYNKYRTEVYDYYSFPDYTEQTAFYEALDIQEEEMYLIQSANIALDENITLEKMKFIAEKSMDLHKEYEQYYSVPRKIVFDYLDSLTRVNLEELVIYILYGAIVVLILRYKSNSLVIGFLSVFFARSVVRAYLIYRGRFPDRVSFPLALAEIVVLFGLIYHEVTYHDYDWTENRRKRIFVVWELFVVSLFLLFAIYTYKNLLDENREIKASSSYSENLFSYCEAHPENNYILEVQSTATMKAPVFGSGTNVPSNALYLGGWLEGSPLIALQYQNQLGTSITNALIDQGHTYIIQKSDLSFDWIVSFYNSCGIEVETSIIDTINVNGINAYSVIKLNRVK